MKTWLSLGLCGLLTLLSGAAAAGPSFTWTNGNTYEFVAAENPS
jgi:hypothetical protein